jgi:hypothetical protein
VGASPEPDVLMKYVECDDSNNQQDFFHYASSFFNYGGQKVARPFGECQVLATKSQRLNLNSSLSNLCVSVPLWLIIAQEKFTTEEQRHRGCHKKAQRAQMGCGDACAHCGCGGERLTLVVPVVDAVFPWKRISTCRDAEKEFASDVVAWDYSVLRVKCSKFPVQESAPIT